VLASLIAERVTARGQGSATVGDDVLGLTTFVGAFMAVRYVLSLMLRRGWSVGANQV